jgi:hypothetical protein
MSENTIELAETTIQLQLTDVYSRLWECQGLEGCLELDEDEQDLIDTFLILAYMQGYEDAQNGVQIQ